MRIELEYHLQLDCPFKLLLLDQSSELRQYRMRCSRAHAVLATNKRERGVANAKQRLGTQRS